MKDFWQNDAERLTRKTILNRGLSGSALWAAENSYWFLCLFGLCRLSNWLSFTETLTRKFYWHGAKVLWEGVVFPNGDQLTKSRLSTRNAEAFLKRTRLSLPATKVWLFFLDLSGVQSQFFFKNALTVPRLQALRYPFNCAGDIILGAVSITVYSNGQSIQNFPSRPSRVGASQAESPLATEQAGCPQSASLGETTGYRY